MKVAIIGRSTMMYDTALKLHDAGHEIRLIITAKESPEYTKTSQDFQLLATQVGAHFIHSPKVNDPDILDQLKNLAPMDIAVSTNYSGIVGDAAMKHFALGVLNAHGGDLPRYRGNACQAWAIINGETKIGLCVHKMIGGQLDSGDIIIREYLPLNIDTKIGHVYAWMEGRTPNMFLRALTLLGEDPTFVLEKRSTDPKDILRCYPRNPDDGRIDWHHTNIQILRLINASSEPFPGAFCEFESKKMTIWDAALHGDNEVYLAVEGQVCAIDSEGGSIIVACGSGKIRVNEVEWQGYRGKPANVIRSIRKRLK